MSFLDILDNPSLGEVERTSFKNYWWNLWIHNCFSKQQIIPSTSQFMKRREPKPSQPLYKCFMPLSKLCFKTNIFVLYKVIYVDCGNSEKHKKKNRFFFFFFVAALGLRCCVRAFSSCGEWGPLFVVVRGLLITVLLLLQSTGSRRAGFSSCGSWAQ